MEKGYKITSDDFSLGKGVGYGVYVLRGDLNNPIKEYFQFNTEGKREYFKRQLKEKYFLTDSCLVDDNVIINSTGDYELDFEEE